MSNGKLIILEGIDGSGKSTNYKMLCDNMSREGVNFHNIVFPRYDNESSALIRMYLNGKFGSHPDDVNAYTASVFFAADRFASYKEDWEELYKNGTLILADRYTTSNVVHQGAKLPKSALPEFFDWLYDLEFKKMCLPVPDLVIYLDVDLELSLSRMARRQEDTNTSADIHEKDKEYLQKCIDTAKFACEYLGWEVVKSRNDDGSERPLSDINNEILQLVKTSL